MDSHFGDGHAMAMASLSISLKPLTGLRRPQRKGVPNNAGDSASVIMKDRA